MKALTIATILHADLDAFYASVEQLLPGRRARELCPHLIFVGGHFKEYQRLGDAAIKVLGSEGHSLLLSAPWPLLQWTSNHYSVGGRRCISARRMIAIMPSVNHPVHSDLYQRIPRRF